MLERRTLSNVIYYFKAQRCSGPNDAADRSLPREDSDLPFVDLHGGWTDATGDSGKHLSHLSFSHYFNPQQIPLVVWSLLTAHRLLEKRADPLFRQYLRRLLDEALYGADYLVRSRAKEGSFYRSVSSPGPEKRPADRRLAGEGRIFAVRTAADQEGEESKGGSAVTEDERFQVGFRAGGGVAIAALALASTLPEHGEYSSRAYLEAAESAFAFLEKNNLRLASDGRENIVDDYCGLLAATELAAATHRDIHRRAASSRARSLMSRLASWGNYRDYWRADADDRPFFHAADAGLPLVSLLAYLEIATEDERPKVLSTIRRSLQFELAITAEVTNPFGLARQLVCDVTGRRRSSFFFPHRTETEGWWQGENARLASLAYACRRASTLFPNESDLTARLEDHAASQLNWILGLNPYDACMLHGSGRNNPEYLFFGSTEYTNCPGGICNGITAGLADEDGIDFQLPHTVTGADNDWRWGEQWLPHAAWYLLAVCAQPSGQVNR